MGVRGKENVSDFENFHYLYVKMVFSVHFVVAYEQRANKTLFATDCRGSSIMTYN